ncbi:FAD-binding oxidoreductase [Kiloniella laminariae]|uniref:FAD-binding oxidoreductase n=1 Tax=Kiloniella laminariae TaxID=454162 RepID=A0ABT4LNB2_9PROT|nr:FAD-binding oxidoreductase [Kiloniella laminariae]MCZ4282569.1 FAD-binding oxidoreductase [Kiloniella laminariae]
MTYTSDVLVIGGGIAGIGAAARISPEASVTVLEAMNAFGYHSTGRSAAIFIRNYGNKTLRALNAVSEPVLLEPEGISDSSLLSPRGEILVATEAEVDDLKNYLEGSSGIETLSADQAVDLVPILRKEKIAAAAYEPKAQDIDVDRLLQGFARMMKHNKGQIVTNAAAQSITRTGGVWQVETASGIFEAKILINAAGAWADEVAAMAQVRKVGLVPMRRSAALLPPPDDHDIMKWPLFASASEQWYAKPEGGKLMVSPADEDPVEPHDAFVDDMVLAEGLHRYEQAVRVPVTRVDKSWAGLRSFVKDRTPVVGYAPEAEGFIWLAGQGGYGIQTAPALSDLVADICLGRSPVLSLETVAALSPERFKG